MPSKPIKQSQLDSLMTPEVEEVLAAGRRQNPTECRLHRRDGVEVLAGTQSSPVCREGKLFAISGIARDFAGHKRPEETLETWEARLTNLWRAVPIGIGIAVNRVIVEANDALARVTGYSREELIGSSTRVLYRSDIEFEAAYSTGAESGNPVSGDTQWRRQDGSLVDVNVSASRVDPEDLAKGIVFAVVDLTGRKRAEEEKAKLQARLHQARKMESIGRLAGGVAHDFNNLLTVINGYSRLLLRNLVPGDPLRENLEEIHRAGERAAGLTQQLLAFSRKQVLKPSRLEVNRLIEEMRPMLERLAREDVEVRVALRAEGDTIYADPQQLEQVVMNLVVNAQEAISDAGTLQVETASVERDEADTRSHPEARAGRYVMLAVSDNGVGMDEETKSRIFEPYFTTKAAGRGAGLGLSMVQGIVAQSGGYVEVQSEKGQGTTFKIYLPVLAEVEATAERPAAVPALGGEETVLVVDDQPEVRQFAVAVLKAYGYRVIPAENEGEALLLCERERIDLLLTDVVMPNVSGRELAWRLETLQPGIKVLFMSGYAGDVIERHGVLKEGAEFIQKPFSAEDLAWKVRALMGPPPDPGALSARILVADDEAGVRKLLRTALEDRGYEVVEAEDGKEALKEARAGRLDLVITDLVMPEQDGIETIQALRREVPGVGIIAISGAFQGQFLKTAQLLGADAALSKPVSTDLLLARVVEVLKLRR